MNRISVPIKGALRATLPLPPCEGAVRRPSMGK